MTETTTPPVDNSDAGAPAPTDGTPNTGTDSQNPADQTGKDNLNTSEPTDTSAGDDKTPPADGTQGTPAPKFDTDLDEWATKTKRPVPETDRERALYQEIRDSQREYSRAKQAKEATAEVDKAIQTAKPDANKPDPADDDRDPLEIRQDSVEAELRNERSLRARSEYFSEKSVTAEQSKVMGEILQEKVDRASTPEAKEQAFNYWTDPANLEDWHALAKARLTNAQDTTVVEEEAARKERERIAKESQANGGGRNASTPTPQKSGYDRTAFLKSDD